MLNYIWGFMIIFGIIVAAFNGKIGDVTNGAINSSKDAITLCITTLGVVAMWSGLMKIAEQSGIIDALTVKMRGLLNILFPTIPEKHPAKKYIAINIIANVLGLGWAATPAGLKAMNEMQKLNKKKDTASAAMCMFMVINMSSVQLISVNLIAYRSELGSANPAEIIGPTIVVTLFSTIVGIICVKIFERWYK